MTLKTLQPKIRPATKDDLIQFHGELPPCVFRGFVAVLGSEVLMVIGVAHTSPPQAVSDMKNGMRKYPKVILKMSDAFKEMITDYNVPVYAVPNDNEPNACRFIERSGLTKQSDGVYVCRG